ncbi:transposon Tf2-8 polyprotein [Trichonephila clavipes]|nr:transposon Tf2-8 polyprotein [Trichonephila clavipes]
MSEDDPTKWFKHVPSLQEVLNSTLQRSINTTPFELLFGTQINNKTDLRIQQLIDEQLQLEFNENRELLQDNKDRRDKEDLEDNKDSRDKEDLEDNKDRRDKEDLKENKDRRDKEDLEENKDKRDKEDLEDNKDKRDKEDLEDNKDRRDKEDLKENKDRGDKDDLEENKDRKDKEDLEDNKDRRDKEDLEDNKDRRDKKDLEENKDRRDKKDFLFRKGGFLPSPSAMDLVGIYLLSMVIICSAPEKALSQEKKGPNPQRVITDSEDLWIYHMTVEHCSASAA